MKVWHSLLCNTFLSIPNGVEFSLKPSLSRPYIKEPFSPWKVSMQPRKRFYFLSLLLKNLLFHFLELGNYINFLLYYLNEIILLFVMLDYVEQKFVTFCFGLKIATGK